MKNKNERTYAHADIGYKSWTAIQFFKTRDVVEPADPVAQIFYMDFQYGMNTHYCKIDEDESEVGAYHQAGDPKGNYHISVAMNKACGINKMKFRVGHIDYNMKSHYDYHTAQEFHERLVWLKEQGINVPDTAIKQAEDDTWLGKST